MREKMSAKYLRTVSEEPNLEKQLGKQMGCMAGLFQLFDRHPFLNSKRFHSQKRLAAAPLYSDIKAPKEKESTAAAAAFAASPQKGEGSMERLVTENVPRSHSRAQSLQLEHEERLSSCLHNLKLQQTDRPESGSGLNNWDHSRHQKTNPPTRDLPRLSVDNLRNNPSCSSSLSREAPRFSLDSRQSARLSLDIRDVVRETFSPKLHVETRAEGKSQSNKEKERHSKCVLKPRDSPRPALQQPSKKSPGLHQKTSSPIQEKPRIVQASAEKTKMGGLQPDLDESLRVLAKLTELPWNILESKEGPSFDESVAEATRLSYLRDSPRFSFDGREIPRSSSFKLREPPRFSLDSFDSRKPRPPCEDLAENEKKRAPSVVARLMGLEEMPTDFTPTSHRRAMMHLAASAEKFVVSASSEGKKVSDRAMDFAAKEDSRVFQSPRTGGGCDADYYEVKAEKMPVDSAKSTTTAAASPRLKQNPDISLRPILTQRCAMEPAPWKALESQKYLLDSPKRAERSHEVLYSEIERRLKQLEKEHCGKDLNKQILEAMQHKGLLGSSRAKTDAYESNGRYNHRNWHFQDCNSMLKFPNDGGFVGRETPAYERNYEAPIVIIKPIPRSMVSHGSTAEHIACSNNLRKQNMNQQHSGTRRSTHKTRKEQQPIARGVSASHGNVLENASSSRQQQHRRELSNRARSPVSAPSSPSSRYQQKDASRAMKGSCQSAPSSPGKVQRKERTKQDAERKGRDSRQQSSPSSPKFSRKNVTDTDNSSPRNRMRSPKADSSQSTAQAREKNRQRTVHGLQDDEISVSSDTQSNSTSGTSRKIQCRTEPETPRSKAKFEMYEQTMSIHDEEIVSEADDINLNYSEELSSTTSTAPDVHEQPSPISVLDISALDKDDSSPSPVKKCLIAFKENENRQYRESTGSADCWDSFTYECTEQDKTSEIQCGIRTQLLQNVQNLVEKLESLGLKSPANNQSQSAEYQYIKEILVASGLLCNGFDSAVTDMSINFPLNPKLFQVLEHKKLTQLGLSKKHRQEKLGRCLVFDAVAEILSRKFHKFCAASQEPWLLNKCKSSLHRQKLSGLQLLKEVWEEFQNLKCSSGDDYIDFNDAVEKSIYNEDEGWGNNCADIGKVALDLERMLFKDLIDETLGLVCQGSSYKSSATVSSSSSAGNQAGGTRRQLYFR